MADSPQFDLQLEMQRETMFKDAVLAGAKQKATAMVQRAEAKAKRELAEARRACEAAEDVAIEAAGDSKAAKETGGMEYAARQELLRCRHELVEGLFADVRGELTEFVGSKEYLPWMQGKLRAYAECEAPIVWLRPADMALEGQLAGALPKAVFKAADTFELGGFKLRSGNRLYDETLDEALAGAEERFAAKGALRL